MQINDQNLKEYKLLYDEFVKYYPGKDPVNQIKELKINKNTFLNKFKEYNDLQRKLEIENKENQRRLDQEKKVLQNVKEKYNRILESNNIKKMENKMILEELNNEKKTLQNLKEDNNKYRKMLFNLYTKLLEAFKLNKKISINKKYLNLTEKDFYPDVMDDMEIFSYIKSMINNINPSEKDKALKQTIAYSNMITRIYLKNKNSLRYDPLNIFKELKSMMEEKEQKIIKLSDKVKDFEIKINNMELENKKLNNLLIHFNQERIKNLSNRSLIRAQRILRRSTVFNLRAKQKSYGLYNNPNKNLKRPKTGNKFIKINEDKKRNKSMDEKEKEKNGENENIINKFNNAEIKNKMSSTNHFNEMKKRARNKWLLENVQMKEFKKIKESRNKDKILKIHNQQPLVKCLNEFNRLIKQTNKLFVYKYKISPKDTKTSSTKRYLWEKRMKKSKSMESFKSGNKTETKMEKDEKDNELSLNIEHKIDELIKTLQGEKLKFSFPTKT
jgi:myosin heavy subunit